MKHSVHEVKLRNGIKGLLVHVPDATVMTFELNFRAGEYLVKPKKWETPHLMEHILLGANKEFSRARDFQIEFEKNGAYNNASTNVYEITYEAECADFEWKRILRLMVLAITDPLFLEEEFKAEYGNVREELTSRANNHFRHLSLALRQKYGLEAKTDQERIKLMTNVELSDIRKHYELTHTTSNLRFVIAGNITPARRTSIESTFNNIGLAKGEGRLALPDEHPHSLQEPVYIRNKTVKNIYFYVDTFANRRLNDDETDALSLINTILTETLYSKILGRAREQGLVYGVSSGWGQTKLASNWWFGAQVLPSNAPQLFNIMVEELTDLFKGKLTLEEISTAQAYALGRFQRGAQTVGGTAGGYSSRYFFEDVIEDYYNIPKRIKAVDKQAIIEITRSMFSDNVWGIGVLGNSGIDFARACQEQLVPLWSGMSR